VHQFGDQPRLYYDGRSTNHQDWFLILKKSQWKVKSHLVMSRLVFVSHILIALFNPLLVCNVRVTHFNNIFCKGKSKAILLQAWRRPRRFQEVEAPRFQDNRHMKVVRLSALRTGRLYHPGNFPGTHFSYMLSQPQ
jgi:hypothetical protein